MEDIILSYKESCTMVQNRIGELSLMLKTEVNSEIKEDLKLRKNTLSSQLYHMKEIIEILESYQKRIDFLAKKTY